MQFNVILKHRYRDVFLVFVMLMITGLLLALSASAQMGSSPDFIGQQGIVPTGDTSGATDNQPPVIDSIDSDKESPQEAGSSIKWTAKTTDPEDDTVSFLFRLKGPSTGDEWTIVAPWSEKDTWKWDTNLQDAGKYQISVWIKDESHPEEQFTPDEKIAKFTLATPQNAPVNQQQSAQEQATAQEQPTTQEQEALPKYEEPSNQAPVMTGLTSSPASPQEAGAAIAWTTEASDPEDDNLQFQFLLDDQPATDWQLQPQWVWYTSADDAGSHSIEVRVRDGTHNEQGDSSKSAAFILNKPNEKPTISDFSADNESPQEAGSIVTWKADANDPDKDPVLFRFFLNGLPATDWQSINLWKWTASEGENEVLVQIRDGKHADQDEFDDQRSTTFVVSSPNQKPAIINFSPDKMSPQEIGSTVTWTAEFLDTESDPLEFQFALDGQVMQDWSESPVWIWDTSETQIGQHAISAKVRDNQHSSDGDSVKSASFEILAPANDVPVMSELAPDKNSPQNTGTEITWTAVASDTESDPLEFQFALDGLVMQDWSESPVWAWNASEIGLHAISARVRDNQHNPDGDSTKSASFEIVAPANDVPVMSELAPDKNSPQNTGTEITWTAVASDTESDPLEFQFALDGLVMQDWSESPIWAWNASEIGLHAISARVRDNQHNPDGDSAKSASFEIAAPAAANNAPIMSELAPDKESPQNAETEITWTASASDTEGDPIFYRFLVNGTAATDWQSEGLWNWIAIQPGTSTITAEVRDDQHESPAREGGSISQDFIVLAPAPEIKPEEGPIAVENETETEQESTEQNNLVQPPAENITEPVVLVNETSEKPVNETEESASLPAAENQTPVINTLYADVKSPQIPGATITWTTDATDADSDPLSFRFLLNGPATDGVWQTASDWSDSNSWIQKTSSADIGESQIKAQIKDGKHASEDGFDFEAVAFFTISEPTMNISGAAYDDKNENGIMDSGEGLSGWTIRMTKPDGSKVSALTREDGSYRFEQLKAGSYTVNEELPIGWTAANGNSLNVDLQDTDAADRNFVNKLSAFSISGMKYNDLDGNGINDGEPGMGDWTVQLSQDGRTVNSTTTGKDGSYRFESLSPGTYTITEVEQSGWIRTAPTEGSYTVTLKDADISGMDFGNHGSWAISGTSFFDKNGNSIRDSDEAGQADWSIQLSKEGAVINATTTDKDGSYSFANLAPGKYALAEVSQEGWATSLPADGSYSVDLTNADVSGMDFGNKGSFTISGVKFYDANENQAQDSDEPAIPGQRVTLAQNGIEIANITSADDGSYKFDNLAPGTYEVDDPIVVSVSAKSVVVAPIPVAGKSSISGVKFNDLNGNGIKDAGEQGIANWQMVLTFLGSADRPVPDIILTKARTDATGAYTFKNLFPGVYEVSELSQKGWMLTTAESIRVTLPGSKSNLDFGNRLESQPDKASIWGVKYNDLNGNGVNNGEPGLSGWTIKLKNIETSAELTTTTNKEGWYSFTNLDPASYRISEVMQNGWTATSPEGGVSAPFALAMGENKEVNFGNKNNNHPPVITALTAMPASPQRVGQSISLTAKASDPEDDPLQYRFIIRDSTSGQVQFDTRYTSRSVWTWSTTGYMAGNYQAEVWVRDGKHSDVSSSDAKKSMAYKLTAANLPPQINVLFSDRPDPQYSGSWVKWTAIASDPEGDSLQYKFYLRGPSTNGFWMDQTGWSKNNRWIWRTDSFDVGYSQILVAVRDGSHSGTSGADDYDIAEYSIININLPPTITGLVSNLNSPQPIGATVWWEASASDPEGDLVFFRYWIKGPGTEGVWALAQDWSTDPTWVWPTSVADAGTSQIQVQVSDGLHSSALGWDDDAGALFTLLAPNQPPTLVSLKPDKASTQSAGKTIKWTATASDPDREPIYYRFWLKGPSTGNAWTVAQDWSVKNQWAWVTSGNDAGSYSVYVYARDGSHNPATSYDSALGALYQLTANQPPKLTALSADKSSPQTAGTTVKWTAKATDANKDPIQYRFWLKGPSTGNAWTVVQDWSAKNQWTWISLGNDGGAYSVYVYVRDGLHNPATSYDSAIGADYQLKANDPPVMTALTADKTSPQSAGTDVKWTAKATDANKDPLLYQFWLTGPSTNNAWKMVQDWSAKNQWTMKSAPTDWGSYKVFAYVRDGKHASTNAYDSAVGQDYQLINNVVVVTKKVAVIGKTR